MKNVHKLLLLLFMAFGSTSLLAQMYVGGIDSLYGNEWIDYNKSYIRMPISADGVYRLTAANLTAAGVPMTTITGNRLQIFRLGREIPVFTSSNGIFTTSDYVEFYGYKNRTELDSFMFPRGAQEILNPEYSLYTDTINYYLTWQTTPSTQRFTSQINDLTNLPAPEPWFWFTEKIIGTDQFTKPDYGVPLPEFGNGEGFGTVNTTDRTLQFKPKNFIAAQGGLVNVRWTGDAGCHVSNITLDGSIVARDTSYNQAVRKRSFAVPSPKMTADIFVNIKGVCDATDNNSVGVASLKYARQFNFEAKNTFEFQIAASASVKYLEIDNFNTGGLAPILYDLTNKWRMTTSLTGSKVMVALPPSVSERNLVLVAATNVFSTPVLTPQTFVDLRTDGGDFIFITHNRYLNTPALNRYKDYRTSVAGGSYRPFSVDIDQIYQQFGYGVSRSPMGIRNFTHYIKKQWVNPQYIVLVGKAREYKDIRTNNQLTNGLNVNYDLPTWGYPGSDILLAASNKSDEPVIPIGRIAISNMTDLDIYLNKVKEHESFQANAPQTLPDREWYKNIIHLSGGGAEAQIISDNLKDVSLIMANSKFGTKTTTFYKTNNDPVQTTIHEQFYGRVNKGVSLITFFGHSSTSTLDFDFNYPDRFTNKGKYPFFIALGCTAGNTHQGFTGISEQFLFYPEKSMAMFIGTSGTSYLSSLNQFIRSFYVNIGEKYQGQSIGNIVKKTIGENNHIEELGLHSAMQEMLINGDPSLRLSAGKGPDYLFDEKTFKLDPPVLNVQLDSFNVSVDIVNIGLLKNDSMTLQIQQRLPDGTMADLRKQRVKTPAYRSNITLKVPMLKHTEGANRLFARLDSDNNIAELPAATAETNNDLTNTNGELGMPFYVFENNVKPVFPAEFAIIGKPPTLKASIGDALAAKQNYVIEIDTTEQFNSVIKQRIVINQIGGLLKWQPTLTWKDSMVYYWRVSIDSTAPDKGFMWQNTSFTYITNTEGWSQSHYYQYNKNNFTNFTVNPLSRQFIFSDNIRTLDLKAPIGFSPSFVPLFYIDGGGRYNRGAYETRYWGFPNAAIYVAVLDPLTGATWNKWERFTQYGQNSTSIGGNIYAFKGDTDNDSSGRKGFINFMNVIPNDFYVLVFTVQQTAADSYHPELWAADSITFGTNIFKTLEQQGARRIRELQTTGSKPYGLIFQKGKGVLAENRGDVLAEGAQLSCQMINKWYTGTMDSKPIGPVAKWEELKLNYSHNSTADSTGFDVIGITPTKIERVLKTNVRNNVSLNDINATQYPFLKLRYTTKDTLDRSSGQLASWRILFKGLPDLAVNPNAAFSFSKDTLQQGEQLSMQVAIENVTEVDADSVAVKWTIRDAANVEVTTLKKMAPLSKNAQFTLPIKVDSRNWAGKYNFELTVNPNYMQPELYTFNNYLQKSFLVNKDTKNPLLDVYFDGLRVVNGGIVSPKPTINVELRDENPYVLLNDTSVLKLAIKYPNKTTRPIFFNDPAVRFIPATSLAQNKATVEYKPIFTEDGTYQLIVKGKDVAGNTAGQVDYYVGFQVITKSSISNVLNYPNPFSTRTQFVYTLTGEDPPQYFRIQIMTISGKVVREITQDEIGSLKIGTHRTDYTWDGTDEYGNKLANGVYLYQVIAKKKDGKAFESYDTGTSDMFKKGIGKMVIIR